MVTQKQLAVVILFLSYRKVKVSEKRCVWLYALKLCDLTVRPKGLLAALNIFYSIS